MINGGELKGALIGAGLGFLGGYAISKDWSALSQAMLAAGAVISTLNGGFEGLVNYAATVAGGYYGSKFGNSFNAQNQDTAQQNIHDSANQIDSKDTPALINQKQIQQQTVAQEPQLIEGVKVFRKDIDIGGEDKYGHWWTEMDGKESYGWWPKERVGYKDTLFGIEGELNGQTNFGGSPTLDPHHGDRSAGVNIFDVYSTQPKADVAQGIRDFMNSYSGDWSWPLGQNCRSCQKQLLRDNNLKIKRAP